MLKQHILKLLRGLVQTPKAQCILCQADRKELPDYWEDTTQIPPRLSELSSEKRSSYLVALILQATTSPSKKELLMSLLVSEPTILHIMEETHGLLERAKSCPVCMSDPLAGQTTRLLRRLLVKLSKTAQTVPHSFLISGVHLQSKFAVSGGGFADIFRGIYQGQLVALKRLRSTMERPVSVAEESAFRREALVSWFLDHTNIQPFIGVDQITFYPSICLVSPWQQNGSILGWLAYCNSLGLPILVDEYIRRILSDLDYLHDNGIIHGDPRGANVLIDGHCNPKLADFGLSTLHGAGYSMVGARSGGTTRFMAPELLLGERVQISFGADVYAFACVCLELHTRQHPFPSITFDQQVISAVLQGSRPSKPSGPTNSLDGFWETLEQCWNPEPLSRPSVHSLTSSLPLRKPALFPNYSTALRHVSWKLPTLKSLASGNSTAGRHPHRVSSGILDSCLIGLLDFSTPHGKTFHEMEIRLTALGCPEEVTRFVWEGEVGTTITVDVNPEGSAPGRVAVRPTGENAVSFYDRGRQAMEHGNYKAAVDYYLRDAEVQRDLARKNPNKFNTLLTFSLHDLAYCQSKLGEFRDAVMYGRQAVRLRRVLAEENPGKINPLLASSLHNLAVNISLLGEFEGAVMFSWQAVSLRWDLARRKLIEFNPCLADSLHNLALNISQLGEFKDALVYGRRAVDLRCVLAQERPDKFDPDLAPSLHNLAYILGELGEFKTAVRYGRKAVDLRRVLTEERPYEFSPLLAGSLHNLAAHIFRLGRFNNAVKYGRQAVDLRRDLAQESPNEFISPLSSSLHKLSLYFSRLGEFNGALVYGCQAAKLRRGLAQQDPDKFNPSLASTLNDLSYYSEQLGRHEDVVKFGREANVLYRSLVYDRPEEGKWVIKCLRRLTTSLELLGRSDEAQQADREAESVKQTFEDALQ